jgi:hypothetical protein
MRLESLRTTFVLRRVVMDTRTSGTAGSAASEIADDCITVALQPDTAIESSITPEELLEFLEADTAEVPVDPHFRERLREQLWQMVQRKRSTNPSFLRSASR